MRRENRCCCSVLEFAFHLLAGTVVDVREHVTVYHVSPDDGCMDEYLYHISSAHRTEKRIRG